MRREDEPHCVVCDDPRLLDALAEPFGTYAGVATCRPVPGARTLAGIVPDLLWALGKTEVLTRRGRVGAELAEVWLRAHEVRRLFVVGADGLPPALWVELCRLGDGAGSTVVFVSAQPARAKATTPALRSLETVELFVDPDRIEVRPPVGAALPEAGFPGLPPACEQLLEPDHAARAQAIYDDCVCAAFKALRSDRMLDDDDAGHAFRSALAYTPDLASVPLAVHAVRAAGLLRGYHIAFRRDYGLRFEVLLTADRLAQLARLVSPEQAAAGVLAGLAEHYWHPMISDDGASVRFAGSWVIVPPPARALLRAAQAEGQLSSTPTAAPSRPLDPRHGLLRRAPPPERLGVSCEAIACRALRLIADPPLDWARPPRRGRPHR